MARAHGCAGAAKANSLIVFTIPSNRSLMSVVRVSWFGILPVFCPYLPQIRRNCLGESDYSLRKSLRAVRTGDRCDFSTISKSFILHNAWRMSYFVE